MTLYSQWPAFARLTDSNWVDFTFVHFELEHDKLFENYNATVGLFGFVLYFTYTYGDLDALSKKVEKWAKE
jgi:hypothetical protein